MTNDEYKAKCQWLSEFYAEAARTGREMELNVWGEGDWIDDDRGPCLSSPVQNWRLKPEPQKAWVVWCKFNGQWETASFPNAEEAERFATPRNGTIQEITRPEPQ